MFPRAVKFRDKVEWCMPEAGGSGEWGASCLMGKVSVLHDENREIGWITKWKSWKLLTRTLKNGENH